MVTLFFLFFNDTATTEIYTLSLHDALPIYERGRTAFGLGPQPAGCGCAREDPGTLIGPGSLSPERWVYGGALGGGPPRPPALIQRPGGPSGSSKHSPKLWRSLVSNFIQTPPVK